MQGMNPDSNQASFLNQDLASMLDPRQGLYKLAELIPWDQVEALFADRYSERGRRSKPVRLMVSLLILKHVEDLSDERVVELWRQNPYYQFFSGMTHFQWELPCHPTDLVRFRQRIGTEGIEEIFKLSVLMQPAGDQESDAVILDTTAQEKHIMAPHDSKLYRRVHATCLRIAKREGVALRRTYVEEIAHIERGLRTRNHVRARRKARRLTKRLKTRVGRVFRDLSRKLTDEEQASYGDTFPTMARILAQKPTDSGKCYSLHEPQCYAMCRGKDHKMWEFGTKVSIAVNRHGVVVGAQNLAENNYDGHTVDGALEQVERLTGSHVRVVVGDLGYRGPVVSGDTQVITPADMYRKRGTDWLRKRWARKLCRWRPKVEPVIGHLKAEHRLCRNFLKGWYGDEINVMLAAAGYNFRRILRILWRVMYLVIQPFRSAAKANHSRTIHAMAA